MAKANRLMYFWKGGLVTTKEQSNLLKHSINADGNTFRAIHETIYEPIRRRTVTDARLLSRECTALRISLMKRCFLMDDSEFNEV